MQLKQFSTTVNTHVTSEGISAYVTKSAVDSAGQPQVGYGSAIAAKASRFNDVCDEARRQALDMLMKNVKPGLSGDLTLDRPASKELKQKIKDNCKAISQPVSKVLADFCGQTLRTLTETNAQNLLNQFTKAKK